VEHRDGTRQDALLVVPMVRPHGQWERAPVYQVLGHHVAPLYVVIPRDPSSVVLKEEVVISTVVYRTCSACRANQQID
jgi:hypothetical protein